MYIYFLRPVHVIILLGSRVLQFKQNNVSRQPRSQALLGKRRYGGKTGGASDDGSEALHRFHYALRAATINPITKRIALDQGATPGDEADISLRNCSRVGCLNVSDTLAAVTRGNFTKFT